MSVVTWLIIRGFDINSDKIFDLSLCHVCYLILCLRMWYQNAVEDLTWICNSVMKISFDQSSKVMSAPPVFYWWRPQLWPHNNRSGVIATAGPCGPGSRNTLDGQSVNIDKLGLLGGNANISWIPDWFICFDLRRIGIYHFLEQISNPMVKKIHFISYLLI